MTTRILNAGPIPERIGSLSSPLGAGISVLRALSVASATLAQWTRRSRQRAELRRVLGRESRFFLDIGISRATVYNESRKWFWQA